MIQLPDRIGREGCIVGEELRVVKGSGEACRPGAGQVRLAKDLTLQRKRQDRRSELELTVVGQDQMQQQIDFLGGTGGWVGPGDGPIEHTSPEYHVTDDPSGDGKLEEAVPAIALDLSDIVQQCRREEQIGLYLRGDSDSREREVSDLTRMLKQTSQLSMVAIEAGWAAFESIAEAVIIEQQTHDGSESRTSDGRAPVVDQTPPRCRIADRREE